MNCHSVQNLLDLHAEGLLSARRMKAIDAHFVSCAKCRALFTPLKASPSRKGPRSLKERLASALKSTPDADAPEKFSGLSPWPREAPVLAAAALGLALVAGLIAVWGVPSQSSDATTALVREEP